jgi:hypothetical protein
MFLVNGRLKKTFLRKFVKARTGWTIDKVNKIQSKLERHLRGMASDSSLTPVDL